MHRNTAGQQQDGELVEQLAQRAWQKAATTARQPGCADCKLQPSMHKKKKVRVQEKLQLKQSQGGKPRKHTQRRSSARPSGKEKEEMRAQPALGCFRTSGPHSQIKIALTPAPAACC